MEQKKILLIDDSKHSIQKLSLLIEHLTDLKMVIPDDNKSAIELFKASDYEFVLIEHNCKNSNEFMNVALDLKPKQKMILLSDSINCPIDCNSCLSMFKFVRLIKPISAEDILKYLVLDDNKDSFFCPNKYRFDDINSLEKLFEFIHLEENIYFTSKRLFDDKILIESNFSSAIRFNELVKIEDLVNKRYFEVKVLENNSVKITLI